MWKIWGFLAVMLISAVAAESVRATEVLHPSEMDLNMSSGFPADDEDSLLVSSEEDDEWSGSGDSSESEEEEDGKEGEFIEDQLETNTTKVPEMDNRIPDGDGKRVEPIDESTVNGNEIPIKGKMSPPHNEVLNQVPMASKSSESIFERTEVLAALIVGGVVGLLFAILLILLLIYRMKKKDEGSYDLGKKPIYKKAPTNEFYA